MPKNATPEAQDDRQYAAKLLQLPPEVQEQVLALFRENATNPHLPEDFRAESRRRLRSLKRHLRQLRGQQKKP
jgi:mRNA-degrading endonuclease RelE of RelBE toxin-antitoxin system